MDFLFVCLPAEGHLRPLVNVAAALQRLPGVGAVEFAALEQNRATVEGAGVRFVRLGALSEEQASAHAVAFDTSRPTPPLAPRVARAASVFTALEEAMFPMVRAHLAAAPGRYAAVVTDQATLAAHDAAAEAGLPVAVLHQLPLSYALAMVRQRRAPTRGAHPAVREVWQGGPGEAEPPLPRRSSCPPRLPSTPPCQAGRNDANEAHRHVPVELPGCLLPEQMGWLTRTLVNPRLKRRAAAQTAAAYAGPRAAVRTRLGLPPLPRGAAAYQLPPGVPRALQVVSGAMELVRFGEGGGD
jgi:hypothetical protein